MTWDATTKPLADDLRPIEHAGYFGYRQIWHAFRHTDACRQLGCVDVSTGASQKPTLGEETIHPRDDLRVAGGILLLLSFFLVQLPAKPDHLVEEPGSIGGRIDNRSKGEDRQPEFLGAITDDGNLRTCVIVFVDLAYVGTGKVIEFVTQSLQGVSLLMQPKTVDRARTRRTLDLDDPIT